MSACPTCGVDFSPQGLPNHQKRCGKSCSIEGCKSPVKSLGMCSAHYQRVYKYGDPHHITKQRIWNKGIVFPKELCAIEDCGEVVRSRGWCVRHYACWARTGNPTPTIIRRPGAVCGVDGCERPHRAKGYCHYHYRRTFHLDSIRASDKRRRARVRGGTLAPFTHEQLAQRLSMFAGCWICGAPNPDTVDHVKPVAVGGAHCLSNLRPACRSCNSSKKATWPLEVAS